MENFQLGREIVDGEFPIGREIVDGEFPTRLQDFLVEEVCRWRISN